MRAGPSLKLLFPLGTRKRRHQKHPVIISTRYLGRVRLANWIHRGQGHKIAGARITRPLGEVISLGWAALDLLPPVDCLVDYPLAV